MRRLRIILNLCIQRYIHIYQIVRYHDKVPVIVKDVDDQKMLEIALIENLQRSDLNPIEEAKGYRQLIKASGMTQEALSKAVSKSRSAITNSLRLLDLPEAVQQMMYEGKLTAGHARAILAVPFEEARIKLAEKVVAEGLSVRATENLAPLFSVGDTPRAPRPVTPQSYKKAARVLRQVFNTNVKVRSTRGKNKIEIEFKEDVYKRQAVNRVGNVFEVGSHVALLDHDYARGGQHVVVHGYADGVRDLVGRVFHRIGRSRGRGSPNEVRVVGGGVPGIHKGIEIF